MTQEQPNKVAAIVERTTTTRKRDDAARKHVVLSYPVRGNELLTGLLESDIGNMLEVSFLEVQAQLFSGLKDKPADGIDTISTTVDGEPAKVTRPRRSRVPNETATKLAALQEAGQTPHVFENNPEDGMCIRCGHAPEMPVHQDVPSYRDRVAYWQTHGGNNADEPLSIGMAASCAMDDAVAGTCLPMTDDDGVWFDALDANNEGLSETASKLIEDAAKTPALAEG